MSGLSTPDPTMPGASPSLSGSAPALPVGAAGAGASQGGPSAAPAGASPSGEALEFFNGTGGFARDGREYVCCLHEGSATPAPWINVLANPGFGCQVSTTGSGYVWSGNSRDNQLTAWSNDAVADPPGEAFYILDEATGRIVSPTASVLRDAGSYTARHGFGYSRFEHHAGGLNCALLQFVPLEDPVRISRLVLHNPGATARTLSVIAYAEPVMGTSRAASAPMLYTGQDPETGALFARNPWAEGGAQRVMFSDLAGAQTSWTGNRTEILGPGGRVAEPRGLGTGLGLSGNTGAGRDPCLALLQPVVLAPGETVTLTHLLGECPDAQSAAALITRLRATDPDTLLAEVEAHWERLLGAVQVTTPDRAFDIMVNGWLLYQTLACRITARSGFYQASGAYGFRDQLQDGMALSLACPALTRAHLLRAAGRQFPEGDVQHWWLPATGRGVRSRISDDCVWLGHAVAEYVATSGDSAVLDEQVAFLEGPPVAPEEADAFFLPGVSAAQASVYEHCALGLDRALSLLGPQGLPLMGAGDWNDGMNRVGIGGRGESVWLGWLLLRTLDAFAPLADAREPARAGRWRAAADTLRDAVEECAWDGAWYRRATFDDGTWLGADGPGPCRIDSIAQSWAVLSGRADPARAAAAMVSFDAQLVRREAGLALLFTPPFDGGAPDPGYIAAYPPGLRENGGQYTHAAAWAVLAWAGLGEGDRAAELFALLNPISHARTPEQAARYRTEPYVMAADIYSEPPHTGRGGWTWYTGSAAWMQRAAVEGILGITREGDHVRVAPCLPRAWPECGVTLRVEGTAIAIRILRGSPCGSTLDARPMAAHAPLLVPLDGAQHTLTITLPPADRA
ncbi:hypothetical protein FDP22_00230 [Paroceanicella profunda]|uniref:Uncharacterized protein n=2 Tax=Paroceanicella profunda TaxID=2579971 RepID=A0A5B8FX81_9RHOB|nr:hypothetical protein FDP22_00230 [Paroceanicella profunda]